jgi:hypothetical protein
MSVFHVTLTSDTKTPENNKTNSFVNRLAHRLLFNSDWQVGAVSFLFPHSWPTLGTITPQHIKVKWRSTVTTTLTLPRARVTSARELQTLIEDFAKEHMYTDIDVPWAPHLKDKATERKRLAREIRPEHDEEEDASKRSRQSTELPPAKNPMSADASVLSAPIPRITIGGQKMDQYLWMTEGYEKLYKHVAIVYSPIEQRFTLKINKDYVESVEFSPQLAYMLGFKENVQHTEPFTIAKHLPDVTGGVNSLYIYAPGLIEPALIGNGMGPVLRIVNVGDSEKERHEENFGTTIQYHRLLYKDIQEIQIEIRTEEGHLVPFDYGVCRLVLQFKKVFYL